MKEEANESSDQEDRDDDDDDISEDVKKEPKQEKPDDFIISDYNKLEVTLLDVTLSPKHSLESESVHGRRLRRWNIFEGISYHQGSGTLLSTPRILLFLQKFNSKASIEEIEAQYAKEDRYASLFPFMSKDLRERYIPLMFTFVIMENIAEESSAAY